MHPEAVNPNKIALDANITVARNRGFFHTASKYTFSPPLRGNMVPYSSHMNSPERDKRNPRTHNISEAPTDSTDERIEDGVEKMPVPIMRPTISIVQLKTPRWRPIPPAVSEQRQRLVRRRIEGIEQGNWKCRHTFFERQHTRIIGIDHIYLLDLGPRAIALLLVVSFLRFSVSHHAVASGDCGSGKIRSAVNTSRVHISSSGNRH